MSKKIIIILILLPNIVFAIVKKSTPYPLSSDFINADNIMEQVYFVNHFYNFNNYSVGRYGNKISFLISRKQGRKPITVSFERYINNKTKGWVNSKDLVFFRSGKLKGNKLLITDFAGSIKSQVYELYVASLRKVRKFTQPAEDDSWGNSDFTFGDIILRKPTDEIHNLEGTIITLDKCLKIMRLPLAQRNLYNKKANINKDCSVKNKKVYKVVSVNKKADWWYDSRISYIDIERFTDYKIEYYKNGDKIKTIYKSWANSKLKDKRANYWKYWYGINHKTKHESLIFIPARITKINYNYRMKNLWDSATLKKKIRKIN